MNHHLTIMNQTTTINQETSLHHWIINHQKIIINSDWPFSIGIFLCASRPPFLDRTSIRTTKASHWMLAGWPVAGWVGERLVGPCPKWVGEQLNSSTSNWSLDANSWGTFGALQLVKDWLMVGYLPFQGVRTWTIERPNRLLQERGYAMPTMPWRYVGTMAWHDLGLGSPDALQVANLICSWDFVEKG